MKKIFCIMLLAFFMSGTMPTIHFENCVPEVSFENTANAKSKSVKVKSYTTKKGKKVKSHRRSSPRRR